MRRLRSRPAADLGANRNGSDASDTQSWFAALVSCFDPIAMQD
jgi:hypothetical protein